MLPTYANSMREQEAQAVNARNRQMWDQLTDVGRREDKWADRVHERDMRIELLEHEAHMARLQRDTDDNYRQIAEMDRRDTERATEARLQLEMQRREIAERRVAQQDQDLIAWGQTRDWVINGVLGAASIGATLALASPLLFPQDGQGQEGGEEEEKKAAPTPPSWRGTIHVENEDGKYVRMNLQEFVAALFTHDIRMLRDYPPDQSERFRALLAELSSFVASDRDIRESKHFRQFNAGDIRAIRETWPEIVRLQAPLRHLGAVSVREFAWTHYDEDSPWGRFHRAIGIIIQGADQIMADPVRTMTMTGGSVTT
jgi:hypothetical protein